MIAAAITNKVTQPLALAAAPAELELTANDLEGLAEALTVCTATVLELDYGNVLMIKRPVAFTLAECVRDWLSSDRGSAGPDAAAAPAVTPRSAFFVPSG